MPKYDVAVQRQSLQIANSRSFPKIDSVSKLGFSSIDFRYETFSKVFNESDFFALHCIPPVYLRSSVSYQAMSQGQQILTDCQYNIAKQLEKKLEFAWRVDGYIEDAEREGNRKCVDVFRQIKADEERHAKMLKELLMK